MSVWDCFKLHWLLIEPFFSEGSHGWCLQVWLRKDDEPVVDISLQKHVVEVARLCEPLAEGCLPLNLLENDGNSTEGG